MATVIRGRSTGSTTAEMVHESGAVVGTVAPRDNGGDGSRFSPTDLFAASLGACACTIMSMFTAGKTCPVRLTLGEVVEIDERCERA